MCQTFTEIKKKKKKEKKKYNHTTKQNSRNKHLRIWTLHNSVLKCFINILRQVYQNLGMFNFKLPILITPEVMAVQPIPGLFNLT